MDRRDAAALTALAAAAAALHAGAVASGCSYFSNDLMHINFPWRVLAAEELQRGSPPLWDPFAHLGMPLLGNMQSAVLHPFALPTHLWGFWRVLPWLLAAHQAFAGAGAYLWLRRRVRRRSAALAGAAVWGLGGALVASGQAPNLQATLACLPWVGLSFGRPLLTALTTGLTLMAGYPPIAAVGAGAVLLVETAQGTTARAALRSAAGGVLGVALAAAMLLPGAELARRSVRAGGLETAERLSNSLAPREVSALLSPVLTRRIERAVHPQRPGIDRIVWDAPQGRKEFSFPSEQRDPVRDASGMRFLPRLGIWCGASGALLALTGLATGARRPVRLAALGAALVLPVAVALGPNTALTRALWTGKGPLAYLRGPSRLAMTSGLAAAAAAAEGAAVLPAGALAAPLVVAELVSLGWGYFPTLPLRDLETAGPLVMRLQKELAGRRYFMDPTVDVWAYVDRDDPSEDYRAFRDQAWLGFRWKLTGVSGAASRLRATGGAFEPLLPAAAQAVMDDLRASRGPRRAELMAWAGTGVWLARPRERVDGLEEKGLVLWEWFENPLESPPARRMTREEGRELEKPFRDAPGPLGAAVELRRPSAGRLAADLEGGGEGTLFLAEPYFPGWEAFVDGKEAGVRPALGAFTALDFPSGAREVRLQYRPASWLVGLLVTLSALGAVGAAGLVRLRAEGL